MPFSGKADDRASPWKVEMTGQSGFQPENAVEEAVEPRRDRLQVGFRSGPLRPLQAFSQTDQKDGREEEKIKIAPPDKRKTSRFESFSESLFCVPLPDVIGRVMMRSQNPEGIIGQKQVTAIFE
jgi:hypothetical protein